MKRGCVSMSNFFDGNVDQAENLCEDIQGICQFYFSMQEIFDRLNNYGIEFQDENQVNELVQMIAMLSNSTRIWENNGFTPDEISYFLRIETKKSDSLHVVLCTLNIFLISARNSDSSGFCLAS